MLHRCDLLPGRLLHAIPVAFGVTILVFFMSTCCPATRPRTILGNHATPLRGRALQHLGLDRPLVSQYWLFLVHLFHGDLGQSLTYGVPACRPRSCSGCRSRLAVVLRARARR